MSENINSHNQKGGITAKIVNINGEVNISGNNKEKKMMLFPYIVGIFTIIGVAIAILTYLGLKPKEAKMDKNQNEKKTVNITSYNQQGGITAGEVNIGPKSRHVTEEVKKELDRNLALDKNKEILVLYSADDFETQNFAFEIKQYLESQRYKIKGYGRQFSSKPQKGVGIIDKPDGSIVLVIGGK